MTDKTLQKILKESSVQRTDKTQDERFVQTIMNQVPATGVHWRVVWAIRVAALTVGIGIVLLSHPSCPELTELVSLLTFPTSLGVTLQQFPSTTWTITGLALSALVLFLCHRRRVI